MKIVKKILPTASRYCLEGLYIFGEKRQLKRAQLPKKGLVVSRNKNKKLYTLVILVRILCRINDNIVSIKFSN